MENPPATIYGHPRDAHPADSARSLSMLLDTAMQEFVRLAGGWIVASTWCKTFGSKLVLPRVPPCRYLHDHCDLDRASRVRIREGSSGHCAYCPGENLLGKCLTKVAELLDLSEAAGDLPAVSISVAAPPDPWRR